MTDAPYGYILQRRNGRYLEYNPALKEWHWLAAELRYATVVSLEDAMVLSAHLVTQGVRVNILSDNYYRRSPESGLVLPTSTEAVTG